MGGIVGQAVPVAEAQQVPFTFRMASDAYAAADGALGAYLREEMAAKGLYGFPVMAFDNGMRQTSTTNRPIVFLRISTASASAFPPGRCSPTHSGRSVPSR